MSRPIQVVKVGGSLFDCDALPDRLTQWSKSQTVESQVLVAGGGPYTELIRAADERFRIGDEFGHWLCIRLLDLTAALLAQILPEAELVEWEQLTERLAARRRCAGIVPVEAFLRTVEPNLPGRPLAHNWSTTTDAIAARMAVALDAREIVLMKSSSLPAGTSREEAAQQGFVDPQFPTAAAGLQVRWMNLRAHEEGVMW